MAISSLPVELILCIGGFLGDSDLNALLRTSNHFARILTPCLYDDEIQFRENPLRKLQGYDPKHSFTSCIGVFKSDLIINYFRAKPCEELEGFDYCVTPLFHFIVSQENLRLAEIFLSKGVDVNSTSLFDYTALETYISWLDVPMITLLIDSGADLMSGDHKKAACLEAAKYSPPVIIERIIHELKKVQGASVTDGGSSIQSYLDRMLHQAVHSGTTEKIRLLLKHGANPSSVCGGITPLMRAVILSYHNVINFFLDVGADISLAGVDGATILSTDKITDCGDATIDRLIERVSDEGYDISLSTDGRLDLDFSHVDLSDMDGELRFGQSSRFGDIWDDVWRDLTRPLTPLHRFAMVGNLPVVKQLIKHGADVLATSGEDGLTVMEYCVHLFGKMDNQEEILQELIRARATRDDFDRTKFIYIGWGNNTYLHFAAIYGYVGLARLIIDKSRDANGKICVDLSNDAYWQGLAIDIAMKRGHEETAEILFHAMKEQSFDFSGEAFDDPHNEKTITYPEYAERVCRMPRLAGLLRGYIESKNES
ncbi:hypothetical protein FQN54_008949 [Arachnomyces sp. PD_36]|nr:hypothetical protein FQN54_008949 [Arachnomyces sp. PD_36]